MKKFLRLMRERKALQDDGKGMQVVSKFGTAARPNHKGDPSSFAQGVQVLDPTGMSLA